MSKNPNAPEVTAESNELEQRSEGLEGQVPDLQLDLDAATKWMENCVLGGK